MARKRTAATAGLVAAGTFLPLLFASPAVAAPGQVFTADASATFVTVDAAAGAGALGVVPGLGTLGTLLTNLSTNGLGVGIGNGAATLASTGTPVSSATASNAVVTGSGTLAGLGITALSATQSSPPNTTGGPVVNGVPLNVAPVITSTALTNTASALALDAQSCFVAGDPVSEGTSDITNAALLDLGLPAPLGGSLLSAGAVSADGRTGLVSVAGQAGLGVQSIAELDVAGLTILDGTAADTSFTITGGDLVGTSSGDPATSSVVYTAPAVTYVNALTGPGGATLAPGTPLTIPIIDTPLNLGPQLDVVVTLNSGFTLPGVASADASYLTVSLRLDVDGTVLQPPAPLPQLPDLAAVALVDVSVGDLSVDAAAPAGGVICGPTPPVVTPPVVTPPVVNPVVPVRPAVLANTGAEPLPLVGLGVGLLAVGGVALGAGPLRRRLNGATEATPSA